MESFSSVDLGLKRCITVESSITDAYAFRDWSSVSKPIKERSRTDRRDNSRVTTYESRVTNHES